jgi:hypothetical protein
MFLIALRKILILRCLAKRGLEGRTMALKATETLPGRKLQ